MVNQIEIHLFFQQEKALKVMREYGVAVQAWQVYRTSNSSLALLAGSGYHSQNCPQRPNGGEPRYL